MEWIISISFELLTVALKKWYCLYDTLLKNKLIYISIVISLVILFLSLIEWILKNQNYSNINEGRCREKIWVVIFFNHHTVFLCRPRYREKIKYIYTNLEASTQKMFFEKKYRAWRNLLYRHITRFDFICSQVLT